MMLISLPLLVSQMNIFPQSEPEMTYRRIGRGAEVIGRIGVQGWRERGERMDTGCDWIGVGCGQSRIAEVSYPTVL
jgi:hypothetical protein